MAAATIILVDCARLDRPDVGTVDAIARLTLAARQDRIRLRFENAPPCLAGLLGLCGLSELLGLEPGRQTEAREEACGVEEEGNVRDPSL